MQIFRSEHLDIVKRRVVSTPTEQLDLYLEPQDIQALADPNQRYTMDRFAGCTNHGGLPGWAAEDKVHVRLDRPIVAEQAQRLAELSLDPGGDLYFTIWDSYPLRTATTHEQFTDMHTFVTSDPSDKIRQIGIEGISIHQLLDLALALAVHE